MTKDEMRESLTRDKVSNWNTCNSLEGTIETWRLNCLNVAFKAEGGVVVPREVQKPTERKIWPDPEARVVALVKGDEDERDAQIRQITQAVSKFEQVVLIEILILEDDDEKAEDVTLAGIAEGIKDGDYDILLMTDWALLDESRGMNKVMDCALRQKVPAGIFFLNQSTGFVNNPYDEEEYQRTLAALGLAKEEEAGEDANEL